MKIIPNKANFFKKYSMEVEQPIIDEYSHGNGFIGEEEDITRLLTWETSKFIKKQIIKLPNYEVKTKSYCIKKHEEKLIGADILEVIGVFINGTFSHYRFMLVQSKCTSQKGGGVISIEGGKTHRTSQAENMLQVTSDSFFCFFNSKFEKGSSVLSELTFSASPAIDFITGLSPTNLKNESEIYLGLLYYYFLEGFIGDIVFDPKIDKKHKLFSGNLASSIFEELNRNYSSGEKFDELEDSDQMTEYPFENLNLYRDDNDLEGGSMYISVLNININDKNSTEN